MAPRSFSRAASERQPLPVTTENDNRLERFKLLKKLLEIDMRNPDEAGTGPAQAIRLAFLEELRGFWESLVESRVPEHPAPNSPAPKQVERVKKLLQIEGELWRHIGGGFEDSLKRLALWKEMAKVQEEYNNWCRASLGGDTGVIGLDLVPKEDPISMEPLPVEHAFTVLEDQTEEQRATLRASFESRFPGLVEYIQETEESREEMTVEMLAGFSVGGPQGPTRDEFTWYMADRTRERVERDTMNKADRALKARRKKKPPLQ